MDHVLAKLEKYSNNLEAIVGQRTSELLDEKRKTDLLLNSMLPPYTSSYTYLNLQIAFQWVILVYILYI